MPTVTYTVAQVEAVRLRKANLPDGKHNVLRTFLNMKLNHMERPHAWTMAEAVDHSKYTIKNNLEVSHQRHNNRLNRFSVTSYVSLMTRKRALYDFGVEARACFKNQDDSELVCMLNNNSDIRDMAGSSAWCEMINDSDKFPDAPTYEVCSDCEYIESEDDGSWVYNGDRWVCSSCRENSYRWSDHHDSVVHEDDEEPDYEDDEEEEEESRFIGGYHSSKRKLGLIPTEFSKRETKIYMGLELEMEVGDGCDREAKAEELFEAIGVTPEGHNYCFLEDDGSLSHGFEMVTGYTGLDVHAKQLEFFKHRWADVKSHDTKTCGLHVHICKKGMSMFHAAKLILFMHDSRNQRLFRTIARRDGNRYSQVKNKTADYAWLKHCARFPVVLLPKSFVGAAIAILLILLIRFKFWKCIAAGVFCLTIALTALGSGWPGPAWLVVNCDVGQGDGLVINLGHHAGIVIDAGPDPLLMDKCLRSLSITNVPLIVLSHYHADHVIGLPAVLAGRRIGAVWVTNLDEPVTEYAMTMRALGSIHPVIVHQGEVTSFPSTYGNVVIKVLWPQTTLDHFVSLPGDGSGINNSSIALDITIGKLRLFAGGDIEPPAQAAIVQSGLVHSVDLLKVAHHGSAYQEMDLLNLLKPRVALISVGLGNPYGHPAASTIAALESRGVRVFRTDLDGAISVDASLRIRTKKKAWWNIAWG